ncbi:unnamed protein product, partial [Iphiclides podalirius]
MRRGARGPRSAAVGARPNRARVAAASATRREIKATPTCIRSDISHLTAFGGVVGKGLFLVKRGAPAHGTSFHRLGGGCFSSSR